MGALAVQALFRLPDTEHMGVATLVAFAATLPVLVSGYRNCLPAVRRRLLIGLAVVVGVAVVLTAVASMVALGQRSSLEDGIDQARAGRRAAENGHTRRADRLLGAAEQSFREAADVFGAAWMGPTSGVPLVGQNVEALAVASDQGADVAATARQALVEADVDGLQFEDGVLDLDRVRAVGPPLERSAAALEASLEELEAASSPWLVSAVSERYDDFRGELADAAADADVAVDGVEVAPALFGGDGDRRYLVLFTTPAEMRGLGGFIGNYAELTAVDGDVELTRSGRLNELKPGVGNPPYTISGPADYLDRWGRYQLGRYIQDTTFSPDFPSVAQVWEEIYPQTSGGAPIDGVIVVDPYALAALMAFTGPITVPGYDVPLTSENAADILLQRAVPGLRGRPARAHRLPRRRHPAHLRGADHRRPAGAPAGDRRPGPRRGPGSAARPQRAPRRTGASSRRSTSTAPCRRWTATSSRSPPRTRATTRSTSSCTGSIRYDVRYDPDSGRVQGAGHRHPAQRRPRLGTAELRDRQPRPEPHPDRGQPDVPLPVHTLGGRRGHPR